MQSGKSTIYGVTSTPAVPSSKRMRLRYAGLCRGCGTTVAAEEMAIYHRDSKQVECLSCNATSTGSVTPGPSSAAVASPASYPEESPEPDHAVDPLDPGTAGASARREHERRVAKREERIRAKHPKFGGFILAVTDEPQSTRAWDVGSCGEVMLGKRLDALVEHDVLVLHDRRIPGTKANIDHIVVAPTGVFVIDAKKYKGRPNLKVEGGILRPRVEKLIVGSRDCTKLVAGVTKQVELIRAATRA
jgi:hypothetical protein